MAALFSKRIKCFHCQGGMKVKNERGKKKYICSKHAKDSTQCTRQAVVEESVLTCLIYKRYGEMSDEALRELVDVIVVKDRMLFEITFTNGDESILFSENFIRY